MPEAQISPTTRSDRTAPRHHRWAALVRVLIAAAVALAALGLYDQSRVDPERFGVTAKIQLSRETWRGRYFTASSVEDIKSMVADYRRNPVAPADGCKPFTILMLGNSQLHIVNQPKPGDHAAPYWLRKSLDCPDTTVPLGVSLANANLQEHYFLTEYVSSRVPVNLVLLAVCFDKLRNDGLRSEFAILPDRGDRAHLSKREIGREMLLAADKEWKGVDSAGDNAGLNGFAQQYLEDRMNTGLSRLVPLWADRANLRSLVFVDLYHLRNAILGIKGTTVRKTIPARQERNMRALEALLADARERRIPVVVYVQPIRQDVPIPYDRAEYDSWKGQLEEMASRYGATYLNLESTVPGSEWGIFDVTVDVDFMHFRNHGHQLLAAALAPYARAVQKEAH